MKDAIAIFDSPVGPLLARASNGVLIQLSFQARTRRSLPIDETADEPDRELLRATQAQLAEYFVRKRTEFELPLHLQGPAFQRQVWAALREIPYGKTVSYGDLAASIGAPDAARAVGAANGANPIAIIVPCHRVIGADGSLVGFGGGLPRKRLLLDLESNAQRLALT